MNRLIISAYLDEAELAALTTEAERESAALFRSAARRAEYLSWRAVVRRELGPVDISYDATGAPSVDREDIYIGVSHCKGHVAVAVSERRCAVDIERADRDFSRAARRYVADFERRIVDHPLAEGIIWCAKETLYKLSGRNGLDFLRDLHIDAFSAADGTIVGRIEDEEALTMHFAILDNALIEVHHI